MISKTEAIRQSTRTDVLRDIMNKAMTSLSLRDIQAKIYQRTGRWLTDGTISRRLRDWGADCERGADGIYRYSLPLAQAEMFKEST